MNIVELAVLVVAAALLPWMLATPAIRLSVFVVGTLATAGSSAQVTTYEFGFLGILIALGLLALNESAKVVRSAEPAVASALKSIRSGALVFLGVAVFALTWGVLKNGSLLDAGRASISYVSVPVGVLCAIESYQLIGRKKLEFAIFAVATVTATAFMLFYIAARGVAESPESSSLPILPSMSLAGLGVALGVTRIIESNRYRLVAIFALAYPIVAIIASGTRSGIALCAGVAGAVVRNTSGRRPILRMSVWVLIIGLLALPALGSLGSFFGTAQYSRQRLQSIGDIFLNGLASDASGQSRIVRYQVAWNAFEDNPILGNGFGAQYFDGIRYIFYLDTPLMYLAAFGLVGSIALSISLISIIRGVWRLTAVRAISDVQARRLIVSTIAILAGLAPLSALLEERGFAVALALMVAYACSNAPYQPRDIIDQHSGERV